MPKLQLTGRAAALVGVGAAVSTAALVAFAAPAIAADSNKTTSCTDQVRVRANPSASAPVIGSCKAGESVTTDESRNGFTHLVSKKGWVSDQYLKDASDSRSSDSRNSDSEGHGDDSNGPDSANSDDNGGDNGGDSHDGDSDHSDDHGHDDGGSDSSGGGLGGIL